MEYQNGVTEDCTYPPCQELPAGALHVCSKGELHGALISKHPEGCGCGGFDRNGSHSADEYVGYCDQREI